jgi:hypothetical protein
MSNRAVRETIRKCGSICPSPQTSRWPIGFVPEKSNRAMPYLQMPAIRPGWILASHRFAVRTAADPVGLAPALRQLIASEDPRLSIESVDIGTDLVSRTLVQERMIAMLLVAFGVLAVGLACLGLYGLIAYHVVQRTSELGIRMALGASRGQVQWVTLRRGLAWIAAGVMLGVRWP